MIHSMALVDDVRIQEVTYPIFIYLSCYYCPRWQRNVSFLPLNGSNKNGFV